MFKRGRIHVAAVLVAAAVAAFGVRFLTRRTPVQGHSAASPVGGIRYAFRVDAGAQRVAIELRFDGGPDSFSALGTCLSRWPGLEHCPQNVVELRAESARTGRLLPLERQQPNMWTCDHPPNEPVLVRYGILLSSGYFSAVGADSLVFLGDMGLLVPEHLLQRPEVDAQFVWLGPMPAGWSGGSSLSEERNDVRLRLPLRRVLKSLFFAGPVSADPPLPEQERAHVVWLGTAPAQDLREQLGSTLGAIEQAISTYLSTTDVSSTAWFVLPVEESRVSGVNLASGILLLARPGELTASWRGVHSVTAAHELVHRSAIGSITLKDGPTSRTFLAESLAEFIARRALLRAGLIDVGDWVSLPRLSGRVDCVASV